MMLYLVAAMEHTNSHIAAVLKQLRERKASPRRSPHKPMQSDQEIGTPQVVVLSLLAPGTCDKGVQVLRFQT